MSQTSDLAKLAHQQTLYPQESPAKIRTSFEGLTIGVPKETSDQESRIPLKPSSVGTLVKNGNEILIESGAGLTAKFSDQEYSEAGAKIVYSAKEAFECNVVLKVQPPTSEELDMIKSKSTLISAFQISKQNADFIEKLNKNKITAIAYEFIEDKERGLPIVRAMSEIAGSSALMIAANYLSSSKNGRGMLLGGISGVPPTKVVIVGAGTVAEFVVRASLGVGAEVKVFDNNIYKLRRLKHAVGSEFYTSTMDYSELEKHVQDADVLIGAIRGENGISPMIVTEDIVADMKDGAVIIDVSIDQGGCIETSELTNHQRPSFVKYGVVHYCVPNIASRVANTASIMLSNIFTPTLLEIGEKGGVEEMIYSERWFANGVYTHKGNLTKLSLAKKYNLPFVDISLLSGRF